MRARLFADGRKAVEVEEGEERVLIRIRSIMEAIRLAGLFLAARRYGEATDWESDKDVVVKYGFLKLSV